MKMSKFLKRLRWIFLLTIFSLFGCGGGGGGDFVWPSTPISSDATVFGSLATSDISDADGYYFDLYKLTIPSTTDLLIHLDSSAFDTVLVLLQGSALNEPNMNNWINHLISADINIDPVTRDTQLVLPALAAGTYVIAVSSFDPATTGAYTLTSSPNLSSISATTVTYLQYRTFEDPTADQHRAFIDLRNNGQMIQATDIQSVELFDPNTTQIFPVTPAQFYSATYTIAAWNGATTQFESIATSGDSGYIFDLSNHLSITPGTWTFTVQPATGSPFNYTVNFPGQTSLIPVTATSMASQWNLDGSLTLSWAEPADTFDQYRVYFSDASGNAIFYGRVLPGVSQVTLSASLVQQIGLTGQLTSATTVSWQMQTRIYSGTSNYARSVSNPVTISWP
ncbi:hypothetical protein [Geopsychrobacter electrodiphilus]|uniref:hypothetical protein n=1 Tax=Geopsychrobacter electrodiphilus TaxID=225196 RepID=UPI0003714CB3|nr:hypothetical protein [Geopsychrobacter electrodiphilus]